MSATIKKTDGECEYYEIDDHRYNTGTTYYESIMLKISPNTCYVLVADMKIEILWPDKSVSTHKIIIKEKKSTFDDNYDSFCTFTTIYKIAYINIDFHQTTLSNIELKTIKGIKARLV
jgi:hypothetical protein